MFCPDRNLLFVHIPKTAGTSVERLLAPDLVASRQVDYTRLIGWCPDRQVHLQHCSLRQLVELDLLPERVLRSATVFTVVRSPRERAVSDYLWFCREGTYGSFLSYLRVSGPFARLADPSLGPTYRGDHFRTQRWFIEGYEGVVDQIVRFESLATDLCRGPVGAVGIDWMDLGHFKRAPDSKALTSDFFYPKAEITWQRRFSADASFFDYPEDLNRQAQARVGRRLFDTIRSIAVPLRRAAAARMQAGSNRMRSYALTERGDG